LREHLSKNIKFVAKIALVFSIEHIRGRMVSECRRYIFGCFDALPRNSKSWINIHQLILLKELPEHF